MGDLPRSGHEAKGKIDVQFSPEQIRGTLDYRKL
jgi:hypothetical protein